MDARHATWLEAAVDCAAAAILAVAVGYAAGRLGSSLPSAAALAAAALGAGALVLSRVEPGPRVYALAAFEPAALPPAETAAELILTDSDRLEQRDAADELVLDDVLAKLEDFSRVVRLFDRSAMPTPGDIEPRDERRLDGPPPAGPPADASQALHDALSELRRSLR